LQVELAEAVLAAVVVVLEKQETQTAKATAATVLTRQVSVVK
jgi:hypothetical protein